MSNVQRIAIIDVGSNSARLVISHILKNGSYNMVFNQKETLRLSQRLDAKGRLSEEGCASALETMKSFAYMCHLYQADRIIAVATAAIRTAKNGPELTERIEKETGIKLHIISGTTEAYISYLGVINTLPEKSGIIFDLGGGSTELILFRDRKVVNSVSLPFGAVNMTGMFNTKNTMKPNVYGDFSFFMASQLSKYPWIKDPKLPLLGVGGTARTVGKIIQKSKHYPSSKIHNYSFNVQNFRSMFKKLSTTNYEQRMKIPGLNTERADIILAGASIINCLFEATGSKRLVVSGCGLREGLFYDYYSKSRKVPLIADDILATSTENMLNLYSTDVEHCRHIADLALSMFDGWSKLHNLGKRSRKLLKTASLLHDIGIMINYYSHARHSAYMIQNAKLFGLTHTEQMMVAAIAGWHNGVSKGYFKDHVYKEMIKENDWKIINILALFLAMAEALDYSETSQIPVIEPKVEKKKAILGLQLSGAANMERHQLELIAPWFQRTFNTPLIIETDLA
jgi:exopolyphosphatase/guanosine-5'-triphosphate,3'-diphosphate pyrophosphatase